MDKDFCRFLPGDHPWQKHIILLDCVRSTNTLAKEMAKNGAPHGTVVVADCQTGGRGRLGRSFHSPAEMGLYMSVVLRYACGPETLMHLTCAVGVSICDALQTKFGIRPRIKWINDIIFGDKKLAGILTELVTVGRETCAIVGIGLNCCQNSGDFPADIRDKAVSLAQIMDQEISRPAVFAGILQNLQQMDTRLLTRQKAIMDRYRQDCITPGSEVSVVQGDTVRHGLALQVEDDGSLLVRFSTGQTQTVNSGEVSIRGMYGYV